MNSIAPVMITNVFTRTVIIMCQADNHGWSGIAISHNHQNLGSGLCSCLHYVMMPNHPGIFLPSSPCFLPLKLPAVTKFVNLSLPIKCQKYLTCLSNFSNQYMDLIGFFKDYLISVSDSSWLPSELTSPPPLNMSHKCTFECRFSNQTFAWGGGLFGLLCPNHIHINSQLL